MQTRGRDWRTVLLAIGSAAGALLAFAWVGLLLAYGMIAVVRGDAAAGSESPLDLVVLASAFVVMGAVFLPAAYYSVQRLRGREVPPGAPRLLQAWLGILLTAAWIGAAIGAQLLLDAPIWRWIIPALYVLAIGIPVYFFARLAAGGLDAGSRQRLWGVLAAGIGLGTTLAITAELLLALLGVIVVAAYVGLHPELVAALRQLADQLVNMTSPDQALRLAAPWLDNPVALLVALFFFSILSPLIEETSKSLATWTVFDHLSSPAQGFALGAVGGAAFGLVESLLVSSNPDPSWATTLLVRGASTMMHIMAASLSGWGIASFRLTGRPGRLIGMYLLAMSLHGLWNACVVAIAFGSLRTVLASPGGPINGVILVSLGAALLVALSLAMPLGLAAANWRFRATAAGATLPPG